MTGGHFVLAGRRALITGANSGIGAAIASVFAASGADLVLHHLNDSSGVERVAAAARDLGRDVKIVDGNLNEYGVADKIANEAMCSGVIDIVVLNASVERRQDWVAVSSDDVNFHLTANLTANLHFLSKLVPPMIDRRWGRVIAMGSIMASRPRSEAMVYSASKAALQVALNSIARDVAPYGVTINTLAPGAITTQRNLERLKNPEVLAGALAKIPLGRIGLPHDLAGPALMLASDDGAYITGVTLPVDGGWSIGDATGEA